MERSGLSKESELLNKNEEGKEESEEKVGMPQKEMR